MTKPMELVAEFITSIKFGDLPEIAVRYTVDAITDCVGATLAGRRERLAKGLLGTWTDEEVFTCPVYLFGPKRKVGWAEVAVYNGSLAHAIHYDDTIHPNHPHQGCHLVPVLFSFERYSQADGHALITAYIAGLKVEGRLARALNIGRYVRGWHTTNTFGARIS